MCQYPHGLQSLCILGGNGTGTELYNRAKALPIHD